MPFFGETIALATVLCWTVSVQFFGAASKEVGAVSVNIIRLFVALLLFSILLLIKDGSIIPLNFSSQAWIYLGLSGVVGFFLGDIFLFKALVELGPRITMLIYSLTAPTAAIIGWIFLDEKYVLHQWFGMSVTLFGVALVILERSKKDLSASNLKVSSVSLLGFFYAISAMLGQAVGYILSKKGMQTTTGYLDPFSATQIRAIGAFLCFVVFFTITRKWRNVKSALTNKRAVIFTTIGAAIGPFLGVSLSLLVLHYLTTGVASTFFALIPIFIIPFSIFLHKEYVSIRAFLGAVIAILGIYLLTF